MLIIYAVLILAISLANFWIYRIIQINLFVGIFLIAESILLFLSTLFPRLKILTALTFILLSFLCAYLITFYFDKNIFLISDIETQKIGKRHEYYATDLGKIYKNRIGIFYFNNLRLYIGHLGNNLFSSLDFPSKYPIIFSFLFIAGLYNLFININRKSTIYFLAALLFSSFISFESKFGAILLFPFVNLCIATGLLKLLGILK